MNTPSGSLATSSYSFDLMVGHVVDRLGALPDGHVHNVVTSPPYYGLRSYGVGATHWPQIEYAPMPGIGRVIIQPSVASLGLEPTVEEYIAHLVLVFRAVRRVLHPTGTVWINIGDCYAGSGRGAWRKWRCVSRTGQVAERYRQQPDDYTHMAKIPKGMRRKALVEIPDRLALALQADGWILRQMIVWQKPTCKPESVGDRPTRSHEVILLLSKEELYYYDTQAAREIGENGKLRNWRTVWSIPTARNGGAHFAVFPEEIPRRCIVAGTSEAGCCPRCGAPCTRAKEVWRPSCRCDVGDPVPCRVLDPFLGSGTTAVVALKLRRDAVGIELNPEFAQISRERAYEATGIVATEVTGCAAAAAGGGTS